MELVVMSYANYGGRDCPPRADYEVPERKPLTDTQVAIRAIWISLGILCLILVAVCSKP